jgi:hypothetical protein
MQGFIQTNAPRSATSSAPFERPPRRRALFGLFCRKERWSLSWKGWLTLLLLFGGFILAFVLWGHSFLAPSHPVNTDTLVVEGWIHEYALRAAVQEFKSKPYRHLYTTGGPTVGSGPYINDYNTAAHVAASRLWALGLATNEVQYVPSRVRDRDRTFGAAVALRNWFRENNLSVPRFNVLTEAPHARRTRLLYQKAFGDGVEIGIIPVPPEDDYDPERWWKYSQGVKEVISETAAYLYARFLFHPDPQKP